MLRVRHKIYSIRESRLSAVSTTNQKKHDMLAERWRALELSNKAVGLRQTDWESEVAREIAVSEGRERERGLDGTG